MLGRQRTHGERFRGGFLAPHFLERLAKDTPGVCGLRLYVELDNERAQQTYARCGMVDAGYLVMEMDMSGAVTSAKEE